jgi:hypothetical protein
MSYYSYYDEQTEREAQELIAFMRRRTAEIIKDKEASRRLLVKLGIIRQKKLRSKKKK